MENTIVTPVQIVQTPDVLGGKPRIEKRRISVQHIIGHVVYQEWDFDQMREAFGLRPAEIHAALAYYHDHKEEIDQAIEEEDEAWKAVSPYEETVELLDQFLTTTEAAQRLQISERRIRVLIEEGPITSKEDWPASGSFIQMTLNEMRSSTANRVVLQRNLKGVFVLGI